MNPSTGKLNNMLKGAFWSRIYERVRTFLIYISKKCENALNTQIPLSISQHPSQKKTKYSTENEA